MSVRLSAEDRRVMRFLVNEPAHELLSKPLWAPRPLIKRGLAQYGPVYETCIGDRRVPARTIWLTAAGLRALREVEPVGGHPASVDGSPNGGETR